MGVFPMTMSLVASFMSAITLLGTPAEIYKNGTQYVFLVLAYPLVMFATAYFYMPVFYNLNVSTSYEVSSVYLIFICNTNTYYVVGSCHLDSLSKLVLNVKYLLLLYFLTAVVFYNLGPFQGCLNSKEITCSDLYYFQI